MVVELGLWSNAPQSHWECMPCPCTHGSKVLVLMCRFVCAVQVPAVPLDIAASSAALLRRASAWTVTIQMVSAMAPAVRNWPQLCSAWHSPKRCLCIGCDCCVLAGFLRFHCCTRPHAGQSTFATALCLPARANKTRQALRFAGPIGSTGFCNGACCSGVCTNDYLDYGGNSFCCAITDSFSACLFREA